MPGIGQGIQVGASSSQTLGSQPLFAASNLIPFAMMDEIKRSAAEAEANYYTKLKTYLDKPLIDANLKLSNPWAQPEFANKIHKTIDTALDAYANRFGGDYVKARIALSQDKDFNRTIEEAGQYAAAYEKVYATAVETVVKSADKQSYFVSNAELGAAKKFIYSQDHIEDFSIGELGKGVKDYQAKDSIFKLAKADTDGIKESVRAFFEKNPDVNMSNAEEEVWIKNKITGENQADDIINTRIKTSSWLKDEPDQLELYKQEVKARIPYSVEQEIVKVKGENADRNQGLKKMGVNVQDDGSIKFTTTRTALINGIGDNAVNFPIDSKLIPSSTGMDGFILYKGTVRHVKADQSFPMIPKAEYDIGLEASKGIPPDRYNEINVNFQSTDLYEAQRYYQIHGVPMPVGDPKGTTQTLEAALTDVDTGEVYKILGNQTMLVKADQLNKTIEANYPGMDYVHRKLDEQSKNYPYSRNREFLGRSPEAAIEIPQNADISFINPNFYYKNKAGKVVIGSTLIELAAKQK
jgi:hypothetical protein